MEQFFDILKEWLPAGISIWSFILFFQVKRLKKAQLVADTREVWQKIAESNNEALLKQNDEIRSLREMLAKMESMLYRLVACKHYATCPARNELQEYKANLQYQRARQPPMAQKGIRYPRDNPVESGGIDNPDGQPP